MMRKIGLVAGVLGCVTAASAIVQIDWDTSLDGAGRIYRVAGNTDTSNRLQATRTAQLIASIDNVISPLPLTMTPAQFTAVLAPLPVGDEFNLLTTNMNASALAGRVSWVSMTFGDTNVGRYVYGRVFDIDLGVTPAVGTVIGYVEGPVASGPLTKIDGVPPGTVTGVDMTPNTANVFLSRTVTIIPEPTSALYLLAVAGALVLRRMRQRN